MAGEPLVAESLFWSEPGRGASSCGGRGGGWYHKDDEHCKMRQSKIWKPCQDLIYPNNYEDAPPGFEQEWGSEFMTWSELIDYNNYNCILKDLIKHTNHFH